VSTIVLVAGAWLGATAWHDVTAGLRATGFDVHPLTLPGLGERVSEATADTDLTAHIDAVVDHLERHDLRNVLLVGHSYGSVVTLGVVHAVPDRIGRLVSVAGGPPTPGTSLLAGMPPEAQNQIRGMAATTGAGWRVPPPGDDVLELFYGDHGLGRTGQLERFRELCTGHPIGTWEEALPLDDPAAATVPVTFVRCLGDPQEYAPPLPASWEQVDLDSGHWPMLTAPDALVEVLVGAARDGVPGTLAGTQGRR
jgi:pimeloyl-ACP methyl ester carboxylesterase